jgi:hypothetical protein
MTFRHPIDDGLNALFKRCNHCSVSRILQQMWFHLMNSNQMRTSHSLMIYKLFNSRVMLSISIMTNILCLPIVAQKV